MQSHAYRGHVVQKCTGAITMGANDLAPGSRCQRCSENDAVLKSRRELFCQLCYVFFLRGKQRKHLLNERYKVKYNSDERHRVLLALSLGSSSLSLLDMLGTLLQEQNAGHKGRQGFDLVVLHVGEPKAFNELAKRYEPVDIEFLNVSYEEFSIDKTGMKLHVDPAFSVSAVKSHTPSIDEILAKTGKSLREDLKQLILKDIVTKTAVAKKCGTILFGHSLTRIANEVLLLVVKGRGSDVSREISNRTEVCDGLEIHVVYPLRDISQLEVDHYVSFNNLDLFKDEEKPSQIVQNTTVQNLVKQYFENLDATGYATTANTVVRTAEKLAEPALETTSVCKICSKEIFEEPAEWLRNITVTSKAPLITEDELALAKRYPVKKMVEGSPVSVCYGCTVTISGAGGNLDWPSKQAIIDEFVLSDEE